MKLAHSKQTTQVCLLHLPFIWRNWRKLWPYGKIRTRIHEPFLCCVGSATFVMGQSEILRDEARWQASVTYLLSQLFSTEYGRVKDGCRFFFFLVHLGKEVNMVCEGPYSCKSHWNVWACPRQVPSPTQVKITLCIKSSCARKTKLLAAILITKLCPVSKILWTWKHICSLAEHHYPFMEKYHLLGQPRMFLACYLYPLQKIKCLSVWILHLVLSLRGQARPQSVLTLMYSLEMPVS